jgi:hypothetical protein
MKDFMKLRVKSFKLISYRIISITLTDGSEYTADIQWPCGFDIHL